LNVHKYIIVGFHISDSVAYGPLYHLDDLDLSRTRRPEREQRRVNVDFPVWMIQSLDREAQRLGVPRQSIIKLWIAEKLEKVAR
jgi:hypothetical protein